MILHFCGRADWEAALATGTYSADSLETEGFIHCSTRDQFLRPANALAAGRTDLVLLQVDEAALPVKYDETPDGVFPHVYGPIPVAAVIAVHDFPPGPDGAFVEPPDLL